MRSKFAAALVAATLTASMAGGLMLATAVPAYAESKYSVESTPIEEIAADPAANAVLQKYIPGFDTHAMYPQFKSLTLRQLSAYEASGLTEDKLKAIQADFDALK